LMSVGRAEGQPESSGRRFSESGSDILARVRVLPAGSIASVAPHGIDCCVGSSNDRVGDGRLGIIDVPCSERLGAEVWFGGHLKALLLANLLARASGGPIRVALARFCPKDAAL
jgi:hypothetical protein